MESGDDFQSGAGREKISGKGGAVMTIDNDVIVNAVAHVTAHILDSGAVKATKFVSEKFTVKAKLKEFKGRGSSRTKEIHVTFGAPNYEEREAIRRFKKAGEPFPVKKVQLKFAKPKKKVRKAA